MKIELLVLVITAFFIANTYTDGKYIALLKSWQKYYKMIGIAFAGLSIYLFMKKNPMNAFSLLSSASGVVKQLPIDKDTINVFSPLLNSFENMQSTPQQTRMKNSGKNGNKRSVSETKKKYVAAQQGWKCGGCKKQLPAWFEVDHKTRLDMGGSNHIDNLIALCRNCHGQKTAFENL